MPSRGFRLPPEGNPVLPASHPEGSPVASGFSRKGNSNPPRRHGRRTLLFKGEKFARTDVERAATG
jgi:hypothetical protein